MAKKFKNFWSSKDKNTKLKWSLQLVAFTSVILGFIVIGTLRDTTNEVNEIKKHTTNVQRCSKECIDTILAQLNNQSQRLSKLEIRIIKLRPVSEKQRTRLLNNIEKTTPTIIASTQSPPKTITTTNVNNGGDTTTKTNTETTTNITPTRTITVPPVAAPELPDTDGPIASLIKTIQGILPPLDVGLIIISIIGVFSAFGIPLYQFLR